MALSNFQPQFPSFAGEDYDVWAIMIKYTLKYSEVWDYVTNGFPKPKDEALE